MEKEQRLKLEALVANWKKLNAQMEEQDVFSREEFETLFDNTYDILAPLSTVTTFDKDYMVLAMEMRDFVSHRRPGMGEVYAAALVLTERFLYHCVIRPIAYVERVECASIYVMESCQDVVLEFTKVSEALDTLITTMAD